MKSTRVNWWGYQHVNLLLRNTNYKTLLFIISLSSMNMVLKCNVRIIYTFVDLFTKKKTVPPYFNSFHKAEMIWLWTSHVKWKIVKIFLLRDFPFYVAFLPTVGRFSPLHGIAAQVPPFSFPPPSTSLFPFSAFFMAPIYMQSICIYIQHSIKCSRNLLN